MERYSVFFYICMAAGYPVIERWSVDSVFYISMAVGYPVVERWRVDTVLSIYVWLLDSQL